MPDPGYRLQDACACPAPVRCLYPMRRRRRRRGKADARGPTKVGPVHVHVPVPDSYLLSSGCLPTSGYGKPCIACGQCLTHACCHRGACQQAGTASGVTVSGLRRDGVLTSTRRVNAVASVGGARRRRARRSRRGRRRCGVGTACGGRNGAAAWLRAAWLRVQYGGLGAWECGAMVRL